MGLNSGRLKDAVTQAQLDTVETQLSAVDRLSRQNRTNMFSGFMAHRGAQAVAPENTLKAVFEAGRLGYTFVELDTQKTSDGYWVLMHDTTVDRMTDGTGKVSDLTLAEIQVLKIDTPALLIDSDEIIRVPLLEDALKICAAWGLGVNVDGSKFTINQANVESIHGLLKKYNLDSSSFIVCPTTTDRETVRQYAPGLRVGWVSDTADIAADIAEVASYNGNAIVAYHVSQMATWVAELCVANDVDVFVYGVATTNDAYYWSRYGIKYIETDYIIPGGVF